MAPKHTHTHTPNAFDHSRLHYDNNDGNVGFDQRIFDIIVNCWCTAVVAFMLFFALCSQFYLVFKGIKLRTAQNIQNRRSAKLRRTSSLFFIFGFFSVRKRVNSWQNCHRECSMYALYLWPFIG